MARELFAQFSTGSTLYAVLLNASGYPMAGTSADTSPTTGEYQANYIITMTEDSTLGHYVGTMPAVAAGRYTYLVHKRLGGAASEAPTDPVVWVDSGQWDGSAWATYATPTNIMAGTITTATNVTTVNGLASGVITAASIAADAIGASELATDACQKIADVALRRTMASIEASSNGETLSVESLYGLIAAAFEAALASTTLTVRKSDGSTLGTKTLTLDSGATPVVGIT